jgi:hypothetical protein
MKKNFLRENILFFPFGIISLFILSVCACNPAKISEKNLEKYRQMRSENLNKPRLIHNNDGGDIHFPLKVTNFVPGTEDQPRPLRDTVESGNQEFSLSGFLHIRSEGLLGSEVTTISYCSLSSGFGLFTHKTKIGEMRTWDLHRPGSFNSLNEFFKLGTDPLEVTSKFAHENGFEFFWSNRMNDTHDEAHRPGSPHINWSKFKEQHPDYLFGTIGERFPHGRWSAVDFSHQEIRDLCVKYYREVCETYDVDGVELDFLRHLYLFENVARGDTASQEQLDMLTSLVSRIREVIETTGIKKGKPILVLVRVPDSFRYCRSVGIDLEKWMQLGLVDIVVGSDYFRLNPWEFMIPDCHKYGVKYYAGLSEPRVNKEHPDLKRLQNSVYRARAAAAWNAGVDGLYVFNEYNTRSRYLREIGKPDKLRGTNNLYFVADRNGNPDAYLKNGRSFASIPVLTPVNPVIVSAEPLNFMMEIGNESDSARVLLFLYSSGLNPVELQASMNDASASFIKCTNDGLAVFDVPHRVIRPGKNMLTVSRKDKTRPGDTPSVLLDAALLFCRDAGDKEITKLTDLCF